MMLKGSLGLYMSVPIVKQFFGTAHAPCYVIIVKNGTKKLSRSFTVNCCKFHFAIVKIVGFNSKIIEDQVTHTHTHIHEFA